MAGRPKRWRRMSHTPTIKGFKPYGLKNRRSKKENVFLHYEEYESLRLCDYESLNQAEAAEVMGVSRPTLTRIYKQARQKIALAMVEGRTLLLEGGKVTFDNEWFHCHQCGARFHELQKDATAICCPLCQSSQCQRIDPQEIEEQTL